MAVTSIWPIKGRIDTVINYARNPEKTREKASLSSLHEIEGVIEYAADEMKTETRSYVSCINLTSEEDAAKEFMEVKRRYGKTDGRLCYHGYQSFKADEVDAYTAHEIGCKLAQELWGDRFQVVIATHCNTGHYHNHFVINSVSDIDGKKFYNSPADYQRMRDASDRLCREYCISVITQPENRKKNYGEWIAEKSGKPTMKGKVREDIDRAIAASTTERDFLRVMNEMGYEVVTRTQKGTPLVHPIVKIVDGDKRFRLDNLGEYYELDSIKQRIQNNYRRKDPFPEVKEDKKAPYYHYKEKAEKATGLYALYLHYCYELHIIIYKPASVKKVSAFLREDVTKLDRYIAQADFLGKTGIQTVEELDAYKSEKEERIKQLTESRTGLRNDLKRHVRIGDEKGAEEIKARISELSAEMKTCRKEIGLCTGIAERSAQVKENLEQIKQQENERKEKSNDELLVRRSSRTGRENDPQRS
jgi:hypothetical protein